MTLKSTLLCGIVMFSIASAGQAQSRPDPAKPASAAQLVASIKLPYETFTLSNGLRVVVHTDRKAPLVSVSIWYDVGSKHEPKGSTGFAHLYEHLLFNGSENVPGEFFEPLQQLGASSFNGSTSGDRTNYYETVPTPALARTLFLESDRMGHLLGAITPALLDEQRRVVQNEKRERDNRPYGLSHYRVTAALYPADHPYGHETIGSMADLDAASIDTVKAWFRDHYGPNNAVLVLAGDIDVTEAKPLVEKYFGAIPRGARNVRPNAPVPTLPAPISETMTDRVSAVRITRSWAVPGTDNVAESTALSVGGNVLGGLSSSRLETALVRKEKLASDVSASGVGLLQAGVFEIAVTVRPGVDPALVNKRIDQILADLLKTGPTREEISQDVITSVASRIRGLERPVTQAATLAQGMLHWNDPVIFQKQLEVRAAQTPASVRDTMRKWLSRPSYNLTIVPGPRDAYEEAKAPAPVAAKPGLKATPQPTAKGTRGALPPIGNIADLNFPKIVRDRLSSGIELVYAQVAGAPLTRVAVAFDAGVAADVPNKLGTQALTLALMTEGTTTLDSAALAQARERLGLSISSGASPDQKTLSLEALSANLLPSIALFADVVRNPAFADAEVVRLRNQKVAQIAEELTVPYGLAIRVLPALLDANSPYAKARGAGDAGAVGKLTSADLQEFRRAWLRPDKAKIYITSDRPLAEVKAALERSFGDWKGTGTAGAKDFSKPSRPTQSKIILIDRPDSAQSLILAGQSTPAKGTDDSLPLTVANDALGGNFLGRLNADLRETKNWSYGVSGSFWRMVNAAPYVINAPVQQDKTGPALVALRDDVADYLSTKPMTQAEFSRAVDGSIRSLAGNFDTGDAIIESLQLLDLYKRPDDYYKTLTSRYRALTLSKVQTDIRRTIDPKGFVWVVVGDAAKVKPQFETLGLPVEVLSAKAAANFVVRDPTAAPAVKPK